MFSTKSLMKSLAHQFGLLPKKSQTKPAAGRPAATAKNKKASKNAALRAGGEKQAVVEGASATAQEIASPLERSKAATLRQFPSKDNLLKRLLACGIPITEVVDVGVREYTRELIVNFPTLKHHLFEPAKSFFPVIAENYKSINHTLYAKALGSANEMHYLVATALKKDGVATHSAITVTRPEVVDGREIISVEEFRIERFDSLAIEMEFNSLLKVDVDGLDTEVLRGFGEQLKRASVVIVEATAELVVERSELLIAAGFSLVDIVDLVYYGPSLYQMDLCFVRNDLITHKVHPDIAHFDSALWAPIT